uniref:SYNE1 protein n=1 Tax=Gongylonema pulchrum TaxID=637853 RepID=A0A183D153_9BILA
LKNVSTLKEPVRTELNDLRAQQERLRAFHETLRSTGQKYAAVVERCDKLVNSAEEGVSTVTLDEEKCRLTDEWDALNKQLADREQQVCIALQELGSYTDAYSALSIWLQDTEESIDGFKAMIDKVVELTTDNSKRETLKDQAKKIAQRYAALVENAHNRRSHLHEAIVMTEDWAELSGAFKTWLEATERDLHLLGKIPTDEEKFHQQIQIYQKLQDSIDSKQSDVEKMVHLCPLLAELTSDEEATEIDAVLKKYLTRYENLGARAAECGSLLQQMGEEIANFFERMNALGEWLDKMENEVYKMDAVSVYPNELGDQSTVLAEV